LGTDGNLRARAYGKFMLGLAHGTIAMMYDSGFIYDETIEPDAVELVGYETVMTAALGYLAEAATLAGSGSFTLPSTWMGQDVPSDQLVRLAHSERARFRAGVARTPAQRAAVDWAAVVADVNLGVTEDWEFVNDCITFCDEALYYRNYPGWTMMPMWVIGMADQNGGYQAWLGTPTADKREFISVTPDTRFPQGADEAAQIAAPGSKFIVAEGSARLIGSRPDRGTWRWSFYKNDDYDTEARNFEGAVPMYTYREMRLLAAEAAFRGGDLAGAATIVNETRTLAGLNATDAGGTNTSCVPKLPSGTCGDLWEMLKWEKRLESQFLGFLRMGWWWDGRGWGDLMEGTFMYAPVPYFEYKLLLRKPYNLGGVGGVGATSGPGTYGY
jgi:hypothetical protein